MSDGVQDEGSMLHRVKLRAFDLSERTTERSRASARVRWIGGATAGS